MTDLRAVVDARYRAERAEAAYLDARSRTLSAIAAALGESPGPALARLAATVRESLAESVSEINVAASRLGGPGPWPDAVLDELADLAGAALHGDDVLVGGERLVGADGVATVASSGAGEVRVGGVAVTLTGGAARAQSEALHTTLPRYESRLARLGGSADRALVAGVVADAESAAGRSAVQASVVRTIESLRSSADLSGLVGYARDCRTCATVLDTVTEALDGLRPRVGGGEAAGVRLGQSAALTSPDATVDATADELAYEQARRALAGARQTSLADFLR